MSMLRCRIFLAMLFLRLLRASLRHSLMLLFRQADSGKSGAVIQSDVSWMYEPTDPPRAFKLDEVLTVMVVETSQVTSDNSVRRRKRGQLDLDLRELHPGSKDCRPNPPTRGNRSMARCKGNSRRARPRPQRIRRNSASKLGWSTSGRMAA